MADVAPAVLDGVAAFMYGMTRIVEAMEAYGRHELEEAAPAPAHTPDAPQERP